MTAIPDMILVLFGLVITSIKLGVSHADVTPPWTALFCFLIFVVLVALKFVGA